MKAVKYVQNVCETRFFRKITCILEKASRRVAADLQKEAQQANCNCNLQGTKEKLSKCHCLFIGKYFTRILQVYSK